jgi:peptide/nickel transport system permease protein
LSILGREILPNIWTPVLADVGIRLTGAVILFSSLAYLGFGPSPPAADWGLMISENRLGITLQPWVIIVPALAIALLAIGVNLLADAVARSSGRSIQERSA